MVVLDCAELGDQVRDSWVCHVLPSEESEDKTSVLWRTICINRGELRELWKPWTPSHLPSEQTEPQHTAYVIEVPIKTERAGRCLRLAYEGKPLSSYSTEALVEAEDSPRSE